MEATEVSFSEMSIAMALKWVTMKIAAKHRDTKTHPHYSGFMALAIESFWLIIIIFIFITLTSGCVQDECSKLSLPWQL